MSVGEGQIRFQDAVLYGPVFVPDWSHRSLDVLMREVPWIQRTEARMECFMSPEPVSYTYGKGRGVRTYESVPMLPGVARMMDRLNAATGCDFNGCLPQPLRP